MGSTILASSAFHIFWKISFLLIIGYVFLNCSQMYFESLGIGEKLCYFKFLFKQNQSNRNSLFIS